MTTRYLLKNIRALLQEGFSEEELRRLCYDEPEFKPLYHQLAESDSKAEIVDRLLEFAEQMLQMDKLLALAREHNSARYEAHQPYVETVALPVPVAKPRRFFGIVLGLSLLGVIALVGVGWWLLKEKVAAEPPVELPETCQPLDRRVRVAVAELTGCPAEYQKNLIQAWGSQADVTLVSKTFSDSKTARSSFNPDQADLGGWGSCEGTTEGQLNFHYELITTRKPDEVYEPLRLSFTGSLTNAVNIGHALVKYQFGAYDEAANRFAKLSALVESSPELTLLWGNSLLFEEGEKYEEAIKIYQKDILKNWRAAYNNIGVARFNEEYKSAKTGSMPQEGLGDFRTAIEMAEIETEDEARVAVMAYTNRSGLLQLAGGNKAELAMADCEKALDLTRQFGFESPLPYLCRASRNLYNAYDQDDLLESVAKDLEIAESLPNPSAILYYDRAAWHKRKGQSAAAIADYQKFLVLMQNRPCLFTDKDNVYNVKSFIAHLSP